MMENIEEDDLVLKIKQLSTQTASIFDEAMRDLIDSDESIENTKEATEGAKKENRGTLTS